MKIVIAFSRCSSSLWDECDRARDQPTEMKENELKQLQLNVREKNSSKMTEMLCSLASGETTFKWLIERDEERRFELSFFSVFLPVFYDTRKATYFFFLAFMSASIFPVSQVNECQMKIDRYTNRRKMKEKCSGEMRNKKSEFNSRHNLTKPKVRFSSYSRSSSFTWLCTFQLFRSFAFSTWEYISRACSIFHTCESIFSETAMHLNFAIHVCLLFVCIELSFAFCYKIPFGQSRSA